MAAGFLLKFENLEEFKQEDKDKIYFAYIKEEDLVYFNNAFYEKKETI
jgi:hypothetical protein